MKHLYTDASFDHRSTNQSIEPFVRGKIAIAGDGLEIVEKVCVGKVPKLKQYINVLELIAIARAVEIAGQRKLGSSLKVTTDSKTAMIWASNGKVNPDVQTEAHLNALEYLKKSKAEFGGIVTFYHIQRDWNPAGKLLEAELERERPHAI